jgi:hypothetical protein
VNTSQEILKIVGKRKEKRPSDAMPLSEQAFGKHTAMSFGAHHFGKTQSEWNDEEKAKQRSPEGVYVHVHSVHEMGLREGSLGHVTRSLFSARASTVLYYDM